MADVQQDVTAAQAAVKTDATAVESVVKTDVAKVEADAKGVFARADAWLGAHRKTALGIAGALFAVAVSIIVHLV